MGLFAGLFGQKDTGKETLDITNWTKEQQELAKKLGSYFSGQAGKGVPAYEGDFVAPVSKYEQKALDTLGSYLSEDSGIQPAATTAVTKALTGDYKDIVDPATTRALYERIKKQALTQDLPELQETLAKNANLSGMYFSGPHTHEQFKLLGDTEEQLLNILANLEYSDEQTRRDIAREREARTISAIPQALSVEQMPITKATAGLALGSLPRELEQMRLTADFTEWLRTQDYNNPLIQSMLSYLGIRGKQTTEAEKEATTLGAKLGFR